MLLVSGAFAALLGGFTLWQRDPVFLQWKPTIVYWIFAIVLLGADVMSDKNIFQRTLGETVQATRGAWRRLNAFWVVVFVLMGAVNLYIAFNYSESVWVDFKLYAAIGITVLIFAVTALFAYRNMPPEDQQ
jgi:intracellular septation protein